MIPGYTDFEPIGEGGWSQVFRAAAADGRQVAVKVMRAELSRDASAVRRFEREGRLQQRLAHEAIPKVIAVSRTRDARPAIVMDLVEGRDVRAMIARGPSPWRVVVAMGVGVARALDHAHARGVIHRDIKPSNVMMVDGAASPESVRVLDFGIAFCVNETRITRASSVGTDPYMAPEQRARAATLASDVYSLGVTMFHMATGRLPEVSRPGDTPHGVPHGLDRLLRATMAADPLLRPASAREVEERLLALDRPASTPTPIETLRQLVEQLRAKELDLHARRGELERLREEAREETLSPGERATMTALERAEVGHERESRDLAHRKAALDAAIAALAARRNA